MQEPENDADYDLIEDKDLPESSTLSQITNYAAETFRNGFIKTSSIIAGCAAVEVVAPHALSTITHYIIPSATAPSVLANTVRGSVYVFSYSFGSKIGSASAEVITDVSTAAINYLFKPSIKYNRINTENKDINNSAHNPAKLKAM